MEVVVVGAIVIGVELPVTAVCCLSVGSAHTLVFDLVASCESVPTTRRPQEKRPAAR